MKADIQCKQYYVLHVCYVKVINGSTVRLKHLEENTDHLYSTTYHHLGLSNGLNDWLKLLEKTTAGRGWDTDL